MDRLAKRHWFWGAFLDQMGLYQYVVVAALMINIFALAVSKKMKVSDLASYVAPYPTMSEIGKRAATSYYAPLARKPFVRRVITFLQRFG